MEFQDPPQATLQVRMTWATFKNPLSKYKTKQNPHIQEKQNTTSEWPAKAQGSPGKGSLTCWFTGSWGWGEVLQSSLTLATFRKIQAILAQGSREELPHSTVNRGRFQMGPWEWHFCPFPFGGGGGLRMRSAGGPQGNGHIGAGDNHQVVLAPTRAEAASWQAHQAVWVHCRQRILRKARRKSWLKMV